MDLTRQLHLILPKPVHDALRERAEREDRSMSAQARVELTEALLGEHGSKRRGAATRA